MPTTRIACGRASLLGRKRVHRVVEAHPPPQTARQAAQLPPMAAVGQGPRGCPHRRAVNAPRTLSCSSNHSQGGADSQPPLMRVGGHYIHPPHPSPPPPHHPWGADTTSALHGSCHYVFPCRHTCAYVCPCRHTCAYVSSGRHMCACVFRCRHTYVDVAMRHP